MALDDIAIAAALAAAVVTYPPIRSLLVDAVNQMSDNSRRYQLCVDLRTVGERVPGMTCEPQPNPNPLYVGTYD